MNTYAELYGNIKKRPLKCGLPNNLIGEIRAAAANRLAGLENITLAGDAMSKFNEVVSPLKSTIETIESSISERTLTNADLSTGKLMPSL